MNPSQCKLIRGESDEGAFSKCKTHLTSILQKKCGFSQVDNPGELLYCKKRGGSNLQMNPEKHGQLWMIVTIQMQKNT